MTAGRGSAEVAATGRASACGTEGTCGGARPLGCDQPADSADQSQEGSKSPSQWEGLGLWSLGAPQSALLARPLLSLQFPSAFSVGAVWRAGSQVLRGTEASAQVEDAWAQKSHHKTGKREFSV